MMEPHASIIVRTDWAEALCGRIINNAIPWLTGRLLRGIDKHNCDDLALICWRPIDRSGFELRQLPVQSRNRWFNNRVAEGRALSF
jgi:hypothetical protein